jgi:hypothetical protein
MSKYKLYVYLANIRVQLGKEKSPDDPVLSSTRETFEWFKQGRKEFMDKTMIGGILVGFKAGLKFQSEEVKALAKQGALYVECVEVNDK